MARGKKAGHVKPQVTIKDETLEPYYVSMDESQFTVMIEGSTLPLGYYGKLENALLKIARYKTLDGLNQTSVDLNGFLSSYEATVNKISNRIPL